MKGAVRAGPEKWAPQELRMRAQWVGFIITPQQGGKWDKLPVNPHTGGPAKVNDPATWGPIEQACAWRDRQPSRTGVRYALGFVFTADDPYVGIDLDHCFDERGNLLPWAEPVLRINSYTELSVSGTGLHIIARGQLPVGGRRKGPIEMYDRSRFFVVTGEYLSHYPLEMAERTAELAELHRQVFGEAVVAQVAKLAPVSERKSGDLRYSDPELLAKARAARNGEKFGRLWAGRWEGLYPSQSEADLALCGMLAFWTGNEPGRIDGLFRQSGLMRPKWDERHFADGRTYGEDRIDMATAHAGETYGTKKIIRFDRPDVPERPAWLADEEVDEPELPVEVAAALPAALPVFAVPEEPEWMREHYAAWDTEKREEVEVPIAPEPVVEPERAANCPPLPETARLDEAAGRDACPWLDDYIAYSRWAVPVAYDGFHEGAGLWLLSTLTGRRAVVHLNGPHYGNLSIAFVARSSLHRKTSTVKVGRELLEAAGLAYLLAPSDSTPEAFIKKLADRGPSDWGGLSGVKLLEAELKAGFATQKGWIHNEFGGKLDKISQDTGPMAGFSPLLRELDDCPPRYEYSTTGRGDAVVEGPYVTLLASCTPADLEKHAGRKSALWSNGFWARFAIICPPADLRPPVVPSREGERVPPARLVQGLAEWHQRLGIPEVERALRERADGSKFWEVEINRPAPRAFPLAEGVRAAHDNYARALEELAFDLNLAAMDGGYTRLAEKALRISLLLASASGCERIELRHWARGQAITERWRQGLHCMYEAVNGGLVSNVEQARVQAEEKILRELKKRGSEGASAGVLRAPTNLSAETCMDTLNRLAQAGVVKAVRANREKHPVYAIAEVAD